MIHKIQVEFKQQYIVFCDQCQKKITQISSVDAFMQYSSCKEKNNFFILHKAPQELFTVQAEKIIGQEQPFRKCCLKKIICNVCQRQIGFKVLSINKMLGDAELVQRNVISVNKIKVKEGKSDYTESILNIFNHDLASQESQTKVSEQSPEKQQKSQEKPKKNSRISQIQNKMKQWKKQLNHETISKQAFQEILLSYDFLLEVVDNLTQRVEESEQVCLSLKRKIQSQL